jgi:hypothetical protein
MRIAGRAEGCNSKLTMIRMQMKDISTAVETQPSVTNRTSVEHADGSQKESGECQVHFRSVSSTTCNYKSII